MINRLSNHVVDDLFNTNACLRHLSPLEPCLAQNHSVHPRYPGAPSQCVQTPTWASCMAGQTWARLIGTVQFPGFSQICKRKCRSTQRSPRARRLHSEKMKRCE